MTHQAFHVNGVALIADSSGALWWPEREILMVADLHLEKGSAFAVRGTMLPPYDSAQSLARLADAIDRLKPRRVIALGDSFHDHGGRERLAPGDAELLGRLVTATDWLWLSGNHDPDPRGPWGGAIEEEVTIGALTLRHAALPGRRPGEISGHYHPKAVIRVRSRSLHARCFATDGQRLILPAFGAYTGGLDVLDPAIARLFERRFWAHLVGRDRVLCVPSEKLVRIDYSMSHVLG